MLFNIRNCPFPLIKSGTSGKVTHGNSFSSSDIGVHVDLAELCKVNQRFSAAILRNYKSRQLNLASDPRGLSMQTHRYNPCVVCFLLLGFNFFRHLYKNGRNCGFMGIKLLSIVCQTLQKFPSSVRRGLTSFGNGYFSELGIETDT